MYWLSLSFERLFVYLVTRWDTHHLPDFSVRCNIQSRARSGTANTPDVCPLSSNTCPSYYILHVLDLA